MRKSTKLLNKSHKIYKTMNKTTHTPKELSKEAKIILLNGLKRGIFTPEELSALPNEIGLNLNQIEIEVIHCRECLACPHKAAAEELSKKQQDRIQERMKVGGKHNEGEN